jgi:hypothetical protein
MSLPQTHQEFVMLPLATRDFILTALRDASVALSRTHRLRATSHILLEGGVRMTPANSFEIDNVDQLLLMNLASKILTLADAAPDEPLNR